MRIYEYDEREVDELLPFRNAIFGPISREHWFAMGNTGVVAREVVGAEELEQVGAVQTSLDLFDLLLIEGLEDVLDQALLAVAERQVAAHPAITIAIGATVAASAVKVAAAIVAGGEDDP